MGNALRKSEKTVTRSFRINEASFEALKEEADRKRINVNTLVNQLFLAHKDFDRYFERMGMVKLTTVTFSRMLDYASDEELVTAGKSAGQDAPRAIILAKDGVITVDTAISFLKTMADNSSIFEYSEVTSEQKKVVTLMHSFGHKGSLFIENYAKGIFSGLNSEPRFASTDHSVILEISRNG